MSLPELCIRRPVMTVLIMATIMMVGLFGYRLLPVAALPNVDFPTIQVSANLPGASPNTMAASVATPLERQFSTIAGVTSITSNSTQGLTQITLQFNLDRDIDGAALDVQSALSVAARRLPAEMPTPPTYRKVNPADQPVVILAMASATLPLSAVDEYAETLVAQRLSTLPGVAQVQVFGPQKAAVRVQADPNALAALGLSLGEIEQSVAAAAANTPVGSLSGAGKSVTLEASAQPRYARDYRELIVAYRNGNPVRLGEVARVIDGVENDKTASWFNGTRSIVLGVQRQPDANTVEVVDSVKALLPSFRNQLPPSVQLSVHNDRSQSIRDSVDEVQFTLLITVGIVIAVIFLFLRNLTATIIPAVALPISIIGTFAGMYLLGYSINNLTLMALTVSVGFIVDDAIVMVENIVRHIEKGMRPLEAALKGSRQISFTIISITLSLVAVFIPVLFMGGIIGRIFREFAVTVSLIILVSGLVSLTLTPVLCSRFLRHQRADTRPGPIARVLEAGFEAMRGFYDVTLRTVLKHRRIMLGVTVLTIVGTVYLFSVVPKGFFPTEDTGLLFISTEAAPDTAFDAMAEMQSEVARIVQADPDIATVISSVGVGGASSSVNSGRLFVSLKPLDQRDVSMTQVVDRLKPKLAGIPGVNSFFQPVQNIRLGGRLSKNLYQYTVQGIDLEEVQLYAPQLEARMKALPELADVTTDLEIANPQAMVEIDRERAATLGVTAEAIRSTLFSAFGSRQIATIYTPTNDYDVILELDPKFQRDVSGISSLYVRAGDGALVPLDAVATIRRLVGPLSVNHQGQLPAVTISFNLTKGVALGQAVERIQAIERELALPATISTGFQGTAQAFKDSLDNQGLLLIAAFFVIYVVLGILYESFIHPITILAGIPSAALGALLTLLLFKGDLSVIAIIGITMLIGIVKKNAIMMIDFAIERRKSDGVGAEQAIYEACLVRFRPIMMTTVAAIAGVLPLALGTGAGAELRQPLGLVVVGGLIVSQVLTLYITPVVYLYLEWMQGLFARGRRHTSDGLEGAAPALQPARPASSPKPWTRPN